MPGVYIYYLKSLTTSLEGSCCCLLKLSLRSQITCPAGEWWVEADLSGSKASALSMLPPFFFSC